MIPMFINQVLKAYLAFTMLHGLTKPQPAQTNKPAVFFNVRLQSAMSGNCFYFFKSVIDDVLGVVTLQEKICHLFSFGFEVVIDGAKTAKF